MSWSKSYETRAAFEAETNPGTDLNPEQAEQAVAAYKAARNLLHSGAIGSISKEVTVSLAGHASDEDHSGSGDSISISLTSNAE